MKQLNIYDNEEIKQTVGQLQKQVNGLKDKLKNFKKVNQKYEEIDKRQQAYQIEL